MQVQELMTTRVVSVTQQEPVSAAAKLMKRHNLGALPVCGDDGRLRGVITDRDIAVRCVAADMDPADTRIREIMSRGITVCRGDDEVDDVLRAMGQSQVRRLPVTQDGKVVGILSISDLAKSSRFHMEAAEALGEISSNITRR